MNTIIKSKKGDLVLRNIIFMIIIFSGIIALSSILVQNMGDTYDNTNMTSSYNKDIIGNIQLNETASKWKGIGENLKGNVFQMLKGLLTAAGEVLEEVLMAPATFSNMLTSVLEDFGVDSSVTNVLGFILTSVLYILIIFVIISAFLKGGRM